MDLFVMHVYLHDMDFLAVSRDYDSLYHLFAIQS